MFGSPSTVGSSLTKLIKASTSLASPRFTEIAPTTPDLSTSVTTTSGVVQLPTPSSLVFPKLQSSYFDLMPPQSSTAAASTQPPLIFRKQYIQQAIRLADDALSEQDKGDSSDRAYSLDCYLASLEYLLSAFSNDAAAECFPGAADRQAIIHAKLCHLVRRVEEQQTRADEDRMAEPENSRRSWWMDSLPYGLLRQAAQLRGSEPQAVEFASASDLAAQCSCGRRVFVQIPEWFGNHGHSGQQADGPLGWPEAAISSLFSAIVMFRDSPVPYWITLFITSAFSMMVYIESRFRLVDLLASAVKRLLQWLWAINEELGLHRQLGDWVSWLITSLLRASLAFVNGSSQPPSDPASLHSFPGHASRTLQQTFPAQTSPTAFSRPAAALRRTQSVKLPHDSSRHPFRSHHGLSSRRPNSFGPTGR